MLKRFVAVGGATALVAVAVAVVGPAATTTAQAPADVVQARTQGSAPHKTADGTRLGTFAIQGYFDQERTPASSTIRGSLIAEWDVNSAAVSRVLFRHVLYCQRGPGWELIQKGGMVHRGELSVRPLPGSEDKGVPSRGYTHDIFATEALPANDARYSCERVRHRVHVTYFDKGGAEHKFAITADQNLTAEV